MMQMPAFSLPWNLYWIQSLNSAMIKMCTVNVKVGQIFQYSIWQEFHQHSKLCWKKTAVQNFIHSCYDYLAQLTLASTEEDIFYGEKSAQSLSLHGHTQMICRGFHWNWAEIGSNFHFTTRSIFVNLDRLGLWSLLWRQVEKPREISPLFLKKEIGSKTFPLQQWSIYTLSLQWDLETTKIVPFGMFYFIFSLSRTILQSQRSLEIELPPSVCCSNTHTCVHILEPGK